MNLELAIHVFFTTASQYYIAGRYSAFAGLNPVTGNILHHAIEMFLKGTLSKTMSVEDLKNKMGHNLPKIWTAFKAQNNNPALDKFDDIISSLHAYEEIRYPNGKGMQSTIDIIRWDPKDAAQAAAIAVHQDPEGRRKEVPHYKLCVEDIDELVGAIFTVASRNPKAYLSPIKEDARSYLIKENKISAFANRPEGGPT
jgi:hypothetical protein